MRKMASLHFPSFICGTRRCPNSSDEGCRPPVCGVSLMRALTFGLFLVSALAAQVAAQTRSSALAEPLQLPICLGWNPAAKRWGMEAPSQQKPAVECPPGYAYMLLGTPRASVKNADEILPRGSCCPLPAGALRDEHSWELGACPAGRVVTGGKLTGADPASRKPKFRLRCTKVDEEKFLLIPSTQTIRIDSIHELRTAFLSFLGSEPTPITHRSEIPVELRFGLGRAGRTSWDGGCLGLPWGSVLSGVDTDCRKTSFQELRGIDNRALESGCRAVDDLYSADAKCVLR